MQKFSHACKSTRIAVSAFSAMQVTAQETHSMPDHVSYLLYIENDKATVSNRFHPFVEGIRGSQ